MKTREKISSFNQNEFITKVKSIINNDEKEIFYILIRRSVLDQFKKAAKESLWTTTNNEEAYQKYQAGSYNSNTITREYTETTFETLLMWLYIVRDQLEIRSVIKARNDILTETEKKEVDPTFSADSNKWMDKNFNPQTWDIEAFQSIEEKKSTIAIQKRKITILKNLQNILNSQRNI